MRRAYLLLLLGGAIALIWSISSRGTSEPPAVPQAADGIRGVTGRGTPESAELRPGGEESGARRSRVEPTLPAALAFTLRGRCVDMVSGEPLADCVVSLRGGASVDAGMQEVPWRDPEDITTDRDGRFAVTFAPRPRYLFTLTIRRDGAVPLNATWMDLAPGTDRDLGDVALTTGTVVTGMVVDTEGVPQGGVEVRLDQESPGIGHLAPWHPGSTTSKPDGAFEFRSRVSAGGWRIRTRGRQLIEPKEIVVEPVEPSRFVQVVLKKLADEDAIAGIVVDDLGAPLRSVTVRSSSRVGGGFTVSTGRDGTFRLDRRAQDHARPGTLTLEKTGYERVITSESYPWGTSDLRLVLPRGLVVEVLVTDAVTGEPIEEYGVRCFIDPATNGFWSSSDSRLRAGGRHEGGLLAIPGVRRGENLLFVEPEGTAYLPSDPLSFEVTDLGAPLQRVALQHPTNVMLEVVGTDGRPVVGTQVELIRADLERQPVPGFGAPTGNTTLVQEGETDAIGRLELSGPAGKQLTLRLLGPGHQPLNVEDVYLDSDRSPLRVEVLAGAVVTGRVGPESVRAEYAPDPELLDRVSMGRGVTRERLQTGVFLRRGEGSGDEFPSSGLHAPLEDDGSFELRGVPPGDWQVCLRYAASIERGGSATQALVVGSALNLREGETRVLDLDIAHLARASVSARVFLNGAPLVGASVRFSGTHVNQEGEESPVSVGSVATAVDGSFSLDTVSGDYEIRVQMRVDDEVGWVFLAGAGSVSMAPGFRINKVIRLQSRSVRMRLLGSDGKTPVAGIDLHASSTDGEWGSRNLRTDEDGVAVLEHAPMEPLVLRAWPAHLATPELRRDRELRGRSGMLTVGTVPADPVPSSVTLVMPVGSGY